jgi:mannose-6-phosphate isomerase-like protein (cupin superfamily)
MAMYAKDDIRSQLAAQADAPQTKVDVDPSTPVKPAQWLEFHKLPPTETTPAGSKTWITRTATMIVAWTDAKQGDTFPRAEQVDEYTVLMYSGSAPIKVTSGEQQEEVDEEAFVVIPPGDSVIEALADGPIIRIFSINSHDLVDISLNKQAYEVPDARHMPLRAWPDPVGGFKLRVYPLAKTPITPGRFGRIYRTTTMMINFLAEEPAPRDKFKLSPHYHDDFEQVSMAVKGRFVHHIRYPWGPDSTQWRDDEHGEVETPSITIIPPPTIHTTQGVGPHQQLLDIFSPPRVDFSDQGWVLNADDYPQPK